MDKRPADQHGDLRAAKKSHRAADVAVPFITSKEQLTGCTWEQLTKLCLVYQVPRRGTRKEQLERLNVAVDQQEASEAREIQDMSAHDVSLDTQTDQDTGYERAELPFFAQQIFDFMRSSPGPSIQACEGDETSWSSGQELVLRQIDS
eukprot:4173995-Pyramimonas_sp.AAC.1